MLRQGQIVVRPHNVLLGSIVGPAMAGATV